MKQKISIIIAVLLLMFTVASGVGLKHSIDNRQSAEKASQITAEKTDEASSSEEGTLPEISLPEKTEPGTSEITPSTPEPSTRRKIITTTTTTTIITTTTATIPQPANGPVTGFEADMLEKINEYRAEAEVPLLETRKDINDAAMKRAEEISQGEFQENYSHTRPDGRGCFTVLPEYGIPQSSARGENIAMGRAHRYDCEAVMKAWYNSEGHKNNMLNMNSKYVGMGCYLKDGWLYWVQLFIA
ncbi:MAG: CAP domain-containing protein [Ruminococcaceae bacterium]|nr:CAP domain-containing protein [Oscillospiraceae bacterium]